jgi:hypothetical protein
LGNPKLTGGNITEVAKAKTTLTRVYKITLTDSAPLGEGPNCNQNLLPTRHYTLVASVWTQYGHHDHWYDHHNHWKVIMIIDTVIAIIGTVVIIIGAFITIIGTVIMIIDTFITIIGRLS